MPALLRPIFDRLEAARIARLPERKGGTTNLPGTRFEFIDPASFLATYASVFGARCYHFRTQSEQPRILDCGANTGLVSLYLKKVFPGSRITAFEADPSICSVLQRNLQGLGVDIIEAAVWTEDGTARFSQDGADGGKLLSTDEVGVTVSTVDLRDYLHDRIDFLKIDIEGAEIPVLQACDGHLDSVQNIAVEYHDREGHDQQLDVLLDVLRRNKFKYQVFSKQGPVKPLANRFGPGRVPLMLDIFCTRNGAGSV